LISPNTIEKILDIADIADVVGEFVTLKRRGVNLMGNCPFHDEKTPSFVVSPTKGIFKCFGCGKAGNSAGFIMEHNGLNYPEALRWLAAKYNIEIEEEKANIAEIAQQKTDREALLSALSFANKYFIDLLQHDEEGKLFGKTYFIERGLREDTIAKFELGYSKKEWRHFFDKATKAGFEISILEKAGLVKKKERKEESAEREKDDYFDVYRERVIFPIHDITGKVIAFGARQLKKDERSPKYINSPENDVYHKSKVLYGMFHAKKAIREKDACYLTEGYLDVVTLHQNGIENAVASSGTSLTQEQVKLISRFTDNITMLYDGDNAGIKAALRGTDIILENNLNIRIVVFPEGEDPDSYCKKVGGTAFEEFIKANETDFIIFKTRHLLGESKGDPIKKATVIREVVESIAKIPDPIKRSVFIKETSVMLDTDEQVLIAETNRLRLKGDEKTAKQIDKEYENLIINEDGISEKKINIHESREKAIIRSLILFGNLPLDDENIVAKFILNEIEADGLEFNTLLYNEVIRAAKVQFEENGFIDEYFFKNNEFTTQIAADIILDSQKHLLSPGWEINAEKFIKNETDNYKSEVVYNLNYLKLSHISKLLILNNEKLKEAVDEIEQIQLIEVQKKLLDARTELAALHGIIIH
jgi:DNA primase